MSSRYTDAKRIVRFSDCNTVHELEDDRNNSCDEAAAPRVDPRKVVRQEAYRLIRKGYGKLLQGSFEDPADDCQEKINAFVVRIPDFVRGLERYLSQQHKDERDEAREEVLEAVLTQQRLLKRVGGSCFSSDERAEKVRNASRKQSRNSRMFARRIAIADELAVREDDGESTSLDDSSVSNCELLESFNHYVPKHRHSSASTCNAKQACRQVSNRKLNCSSLHTLSSLASSFRSNSSKSLISCSSASSNSSSTAESFASSMIHPSLIICRNRHRDQALKVPGRPSMACECAEVIRQSALDLVNSAEEDDSSDVFGMIPRGMAMSA